MNESFICMGPLLKVSHENAPDARTKSSVTTLAQAIVRIASPVSTENDTEVYCYFTGTNKECSVNVPTATNGFTLNSDSVATESWLFFKNSSLFIIASFPIRLPSW